MALITFDRIAKSFRGKALWEDVSAEVPRQARIGLLGSAACGKTTLLRVLAGREMPERGRVLRARHLRVGWPTAAAFRGSEAGLTVHAYCLEAFARLQAQERELTRLEQDLADPRRAADLLPRYGPLQEEFEGQGGYQYRGRVDQMLDRLGLLASAADRRLGDLQGPDRMRARLVRVLLEDPDLLLLDEPGRLLSAEQAEWLAGWLREWPGAWVIAAPFGPALGGDVECVWRLGAPGFEVDSTGGMTAATLGRSLRWAAESTPLRRL